MPFKKTLCKVDKQDIRDHLDEVAREVLSARFVCRKCGRAASKKRLLCKPTAIDDCLNGASPDSG